MQAFADDLEGKPTNVYFGQPPSDTPASTTSTASAEQDSKGTARSSSSSSSSSSTDYRTPPHPSFTSARDRDSSDPPEVEPEYRGRDEPSDPAEVGDSGVLGKVASAIGGVLGWADRLFGKRK
jgi:molecular chaperone DnaJ